MFTTDMTCTVACGTPLLIVDYLSGQCGHGSQHGVIASYVNPPLVGTVANFSCPPGLVLIGPNTTTCMENGEWEPDPSSMACEIEGNAEYEQLHI